MSGRDDHAPCVPDCFGCRWLIVIKHWSPLERKVTTKHDCVRSRLEVPHRCNEYQTQPLNVPRETNNAPEGG